MVGILQVNGHGEESTLMQDLKPFRILISLLDKPELGNCHITTSSLYFVSHGLLNGIFFFLLLVKSKKAFFLMTVLVLSGYWISRFFQTNNFMSLLIYLHPNAISSTFTT